MAEIQKNVEKEKHIRELGLARYYRYREKNPDKVREQRRVYMNKYRERKRNEKEETNETSDA